MDDVKHPLVFADYHHGDLWYSLHCLFEKRFGGTLVRPIGHEWFEKGFWKLAEPYGNAPDTIDQYLGIPDVAWSKKKEPCQEYGRAELIDDIYHIPVKVASEEYVQKAATFQQFQKMDFDFVIATYQGHEEPYYRLVKEYMPKASFVRALGDTSVVPVCARNVMAAVNTPLPSHINYIRYFPEHHPDYCYTPPANHNVIKSFLTHFRTMPDYRDFTIYEKAMTDFMFKMHGIDERDGVISGNLMPQTIKDAGFVWHVKYTGCGGFLPRQALSCGRPVIVKKHYCYEYFTMEGDLFEDSVNCIDLDLESYQRNILKIRWFSDPDRHNEMCKATAAKFKKDVDFDKEASKIEAWLGSLQRR